MQSIHGTAQCVPLAAGYRLKSHPFCFKVLAFFCFQGMYEVVWEWIGFPGPQKWEFKIVSGHGWHFNDCKAAAPTWDCNSHSLLGGKHRKATTCVFDCQFSLCIGPVEYEENLFNTALMLWLQINNQYWSVHISSFLLCQPLCRLISLVPPNWLTSY